MAHQMLSLVTMSTNRSIAWLSSPNQMPQIGKWHCVLKPTFYSVVVCFLVGDDQD